MVLEGLMKALMTCDTIRDLEGFIKTPHGDMVEADDTKKSKKKRKLREEVAKAEAKKNMQEQAANKAAELVKKQAEEKKKGELQAAWSQVNADKRVQEASKKAQKEAADAKIRAQDIAATLTAKTLALAKSQKSVPEVVPESQAGC